jgi:hypothetical protein
MDTRGISQNKQEKLGFNLAKVRVDGSNPFARSKFISKTMT